MTLLLQETLVHAPVGLPFRSTWRTAAAGETITLPLSGGAGSAYSFVVDWGDGTIETITSANDPKRIHHYAAAGDHQVSITGTLTGWAFNNAGDKLKIRSIDQWGILRFTDTQIGHFYGCTNLTLPATDKLVMSASCEGMFRACASLVTSPSLVNADTSNVRTMATMFASGATLFNAPITGWNVSKVTNMIGVFSSCSAFNQDISGWDISSATTISGMFYKAIAFNQNIGVWNTSNVTDMSSVFSGATAFNKDIGNWKTGNVTTFASMFLNATAFNQDISRWDTSKVTAMNLMFQQATNFNQPINAWNVSKVKTMQSMFYLAPKFNQPLNLWDVSAVTDMSYMFNSANAFNQDISGWNTINVTNMSYMFSENTAFNCGQPAGLVHSLMQRTAAGGWRIGGISSANLNNMFFHATAFAGDISSWCANVATTPPTSFSAGANANFTPTMHPTWGACPIPD